MINRGMLEMSLVWDGANFRVGRCGCDSDGVSGMMVLLRVVVRCQMWRDSTWAERGAA